LAAELAFHVLFEHYITRRSNVFTSNEALDDQGAGFRGGDNDATIVDSTHERTDSLEGLEYES